MKSEAGPHPQPGVPPHAFYIVEHALQGRKMLQQILKPSAVDSSMEAVEERHRALELSQRPVWRIECSPTVGPRRKGSRTPLTRLRIDFPDSVL